MPNALRIPYGLDGTGRMVNVADVPRGKACGCRCPGCDARLVARKGRIRQHHFAHLAPAPACESWLHSTAKHLLYQRITEAIAGATPLPIRWQCHYCAGYRAHSRGIPYEHCRDLLGKRRIDGVAMEQAWPERDIQPDITLLTGGTAAILIEIVVSHQPEYTVAEIGLPVLELHLTNAEQLDALTTGALPVAKLSNYPCPDPICQDCEQRQSHGHNQCAICNQCKKPGNIHCAICSGHYPEEHRHCSECSNGFIRKQWHHHRCQQCYEIWLYQKLSHCEQCGRKLPERYVGIYELCYPCHRQALRTEQERVQKQINDRAERWRSAGREEREAMLAEWHNPYGPVS